eukprot:gene23188-31508_t
MKKTATEELNADELTAIFALRNLTVPTIKNEDPSVPSSENHQDDDNESVTSEISNDGIFLEANNDIKDGAEFYIERTIKKIRSVCPDAIINLLDPQLDKIIRSVCVTSIESASTHLKYIMAEANLLFLNDSIEKDVLFKVEVLLKAVAVYYLSLQSLNIHDEIDSVEELLKEYSSYNIFSECSTDAEEARYLLDFRNYMKKALRIIPAKRNKMLLVHVCAILEGSKRSYVKGGTQSSATTRRTIIYEHESGHHKICRPRPEGHSRGTKSIHPLLLSKSEIVKCPCGALVRENVMDMHVQKDKHKRILASLGTTPIPPPMRADYVNMPPQSLQSHHSRLQQQQQQQHHPLPQLIPLSRPHGGQYPPFPPMYRADYVSSSMMSQPSLFTVHCGLPMPMPMTMYSPIQWVYQTSQPSVSYTSSSTSTSMQYVQLDSPPAAMSSADLPQWSPPHWKR